MTVNCPPRENLRAFLSGTLDEPSADSVMGHISTCNLCNETLTELDQEEDSFFAELRDRPVLDRYLEESECHHLVEAVAQFGREPSRLGGRYAAFSEMEELETLGQYKLICRLGQGGMGAVYKALHTRLNKIVALKVVNPSRLTDPRAIARFEREMKAVGSLEHPNIVRAMDAGEHDGRHFLVMEYCEGRDLSKIVESQGPLSIADACEAVRQAALGLQFIHENGLVHRDIKPSNLMLTTGGQLKILDLGLALLSREMREDETDLTVASDIMGTIDYMAPEQVDRSHDVDIRADIYALGATLYKLLTGRAPFTGENYNTPLKKIRALATETPPAIAEMRADVPTEMATALSRMLTRDPDDRFATPAEVADALGPLASGCDLSALVAAIASQSDFDELDEKVERLIGSTHSHLSSAMTGTHSSHGASSNQPTLSSVRHLPRWLPLTAVAALFLIILTAWQIVVRVRDHDGNETVVQVPPGSEVTVDPEGNIEVTLPEGVTLPDPPNRHPRAGGDPDGNNAVPDAPIAALPNLREYEAGEPISLQTLVFEPAEIEGLASWTVDTTGHRGRVRAITYSDDGAWMATGGDDATVRLWRLGDDRPVRLLVGHDDAIVDLSFVDASTLISASRDGAIKVWNFGTGNPQGEFQVDGECTTLAVSPDRNYFVAGRQDGRIELWDLASGLVVEVFSAHTQQVSDLLWSADSQTFYTAGSDGTIAQWEVTDVETEGVGDELQRIEAHAEGNIHMALSPSGEQLLTSGADKRYRLWDAVTGEEQPQGGECSEAITAIAWLSEGRRFLVATANQESTPPTSGLRVYNSISGNLLRTLPHERWVQALVRSPDHSRLACGGDWGSITFLNQRTLDQDDEIEGLGPLSVGFRDAVWSPDGATLVTGDNYTLSAWSYTNELVRRTLHYNNREVKDSHGNSFIAWLAFSPDGHTIGFSSIGDITVRLLDLESGRIIHRLFTHGPDSRMSYARSGGGRKTYAWSPDGQRIAARAHSNQFHIWEVETGTVLRTLDATDTVNAVAWSTHGELLATAAGATDRRTVQIWNPETGELLHTLEQTHIIDSLEFAPDGTTLAVGFQWNGGLQLWNAEIGERLFAWDRASDHLNMAFSPEGDFLAIAQHTRGVELWDMAAEEIVQNLRLPEGSSAQTVAWSPDGQRLTSGDYSDSGGARFITIWDPQTGEVTSRLFAWGHEGGIALSSDGHYSVTQNKADQLVYVAVTDDGQQLTLTPAEFESQYGWQNDPARALQLAE